MINFDIDKDGNIKFKKNVIVLELKDLNTMNLGTILTNSYDPYRQQDVLNIFYKIDALLGENSIDDNMAALSLYLGAMVTTLRYKGE